MRSALLLCLLVAPMANAQEPPPPTAPAAGRGSISGVVTKRPGGEPAAGAAVRLQGEPFSVGPQANRAHTVAVGADGSFLLTDVEPGTYWLVANLQGFLPFEYGQRSPTGVGMSFDVRDGQRVTVRLALWPTASIAGRVVDADGDPAGQVQVLALRQIYEGGKPALTIAQSVMTNDRGEYRMFWLAPGSYRVAARAFESNSITPAVNVGPPRRFGTSQQGTSPVVTSRRLEKGEVLEEAAIPIFAPSSPDLLRAQTIVLQPGEQVAGVDVQLVGSRVPAHHVRGVVQSLSKQGAVRPGSQVVIVSREPSPMAIVPSATVRADGSFDVPGVAAGSYVVYLRDGVAALPIQVGDSDVDIVLAETDGVEIPGRITIERGLATGAVDMSNLRFQVSRDPDGVGTPPGGPRFNPPPAADGSFMWTISPGDFRVDVAPLVNTVRDDNTRAGGGPRVSDALQNAYVKSIRWGRSDVLADGLHTWNGSQGSLEIVVSLAGAEVEGTVRDNARQPAAGVTVAAVPDGNIRGRSDLVRHGTTDRDGHFTIRGLAPGDYSFYAWDDVERGAWQSAEFVRAFEGRGRFVRLREGTNETVDLTLLVGR